MTSRLPPPLAPPSHSATATSKAAGEPLLPPPLHPSISPDSRRASAGRIRTPSPGPGETYPDPPTPALTPPTTTPALTPPLHPASLIARAPSSTPRSTTSAEAPPVPARLVPEATAAVEDIEAADEEKEITVPGGLSLNSADQAILTPAQEEAIRQQLEDEEINWYLESFGKHVQHLRVASQTEAETSAIMPKPLLVDFTFEAVAKRKALEQTAAREALVDDVEGSEEDPSLVQATEAPLEESVEKGTAGTSVAYTDVDWWAYAAAYARYVLGPPTPSKLHEPFSIPRFKSNAERLYVVAIPAWQMILSEIGDLCLWKNTWRTLFAISVYTAQIITSSFVSTTCLLILYKLLKTRFFPPSPLSLYQAALEARRRAQEAEALTDEVTGAEDGDAQGESQGETGDFGINIDLSKARKGLGLAGEALHMAEAEGKNVKGKKEKKKLRKKLKELEIELGAGAVVVLGDIADVHEKIKNLFMWRSPTASTNFALALAISAVVSHMMPIWIMVKLVQIALGVVAFVVVPLIAAQERYEPCSWLIGGAPTDSEYAMHLIRKRAAAGKPIINNKRLAKPSRSMSATPSILSSITDSSVSELTRVGTSDDVVSVPAKSKGFSWDKVLAVGEKGTRLMESSRQYATGERGVELKLARPGDTLQSSGILTQMKLGSGGPGLVLTRKEGPAAPQTADAVSYLAQYRARPGSLSISTTEIHFKPFISSSKAEGAADQALAKDKEIIIPMEDVVGIRKRDKTTFLVVVSAGLEIECKDGRTIRFAFVANRDQAFNRLVASSHQAFAKV